MKIFRHNFLPIFYSFVGVILTNILFVMFPEFWCSMFIGKISFSLIPTFQDWMWFFFYIGIIEVRLKWIESLKVKDFLGKKYLPESFEVIIDEQELTQVIRNVRDDEKKEHSLLAQLILQVALQFRSNNSVGLAMDFLDKNLELIFHRIDLRYQQLKYLIWLIPTLGFIGTVYGIGLAVNNLGHGSLDDPKLLTEMAGNLGIAFNTTLLALLLSVVLQYLIQKLEASEEQMMTTFGEYIMENLINRLVENRQVL